MNLNKMFDALNRSGISSGLAGGLAGGVVSGALMSKKGRKFAGSALKVGGIAAVGGLAYKAYRSYQQNQNAANGGLTPELAAGHAGSAALNRSSGYAARAEHHPKWSELSQEQFEHDGEEQHSVGLLLIRAMIAAANADGHIDDDERRKIFEQVEQQNLSNEEKALLFDALSKPDTLEQISASVGDPVVAAEVYTVSALAVDETQTAAKFYLQALASRLKLPSEIVGNIHNELSQLSPA